MKTLEEIEIEALAYGQAMYDKFMETEPEWSSALTANNSYNIRKRQLLKENGYDDQKS